MPRMKKINPIGDGGLARNEKRASAPSCELPGGADHLCRKLRRADHCASSRIIVPKAPKKAKPDKVIVINKQ